MRADGATPSSAREQRHRYVGRVYLRRAIASSMPPIGGAGSLWMLNGPAGIGKTALAAEVIRELGTSAVWGRSWDGGAAPSYWPWTQVVRALSGRDTGTQLRPLVLDEEPADRFVLFDTVASVLRTHTTAPSIIVLDDLHEADEASLLLTRFVAGQLHDIPLLLIATARTVDPTDHRATHLDALRRMGQAVELDGLTTSDIGELIEDPSTAAEVRSVTGGNPMLIRQIAINGGAGLGSGFAGEPSRRLREVVELRLRLLPPELLTTAAAIAILGHEATPHVVGDLLDAPEPSIIDHVKQLTDEAIIATDDDDHLVPTHPLLVEVATSLLADGVRSELHGRAATLGIYDAHPEARAYHLLRAGPARLDAAIDASRRAAERALADHAHEDAAIHLRGALDALATAGAPSPRLEFNLTLALGRTLWRASQRMAARQAFDRAWELATELDDPEAMAWAALQGGIQYFFTGDGGDVHAQRDATALERVPPGSHDIRARLLADMATKRLAPHQWPASRALARESLSIARSHGGDYALGHALAAEHVTALGPATLDRRIRSARELLAVAQRSGIHDLEVHGRFLLMGALLEKAEIRGLEDVLAAQHEAVDRLAEPRFARFVLWFRCVQALFDGRAEDAIELATACLELAEQFADPDGFAVHAGQVTVARWMQGRLAETEPLYADMQRAEPHEPLWGTSLAFIHATSGQLDAAQGQVARAPHVDDIPDGQHWLLTATTLAEAAALIGDRDRCAELREALLPYADRLVPIGMGAACWTVVARPLGLATLRVGYIDEGLRHLQRAIDVAARIGATPWLIEAQLDLAEALVEHRSGSEERVASLADQALARATARHLPWFAERAASVLTSVGTPSSTMARAAPPDDARSAPVAAPLPRIAVLGTFEVTGADGTVASWKSRKARELLKLLVARRGTPVLREQAMDVLWPGESPSEVSNRLSVALSTIRRALDPARTHDANHFVTADRSTIRLRTDHLAVDSEELLAAAKTASELPERRAALERLRGEALADEPYSDWAAPLRREVNAVVTTLARQVASAVIADDPLGAIDAYRALLTIDPYDQPALLGTVEALIAIGALGQATRAYDEYRDRCAQLGVEAEPAPPGLGLA